MTPYCHAHSSLLKRGPMTLLRYDPLPGVEVKDCSPLLLVPSIINRAYIFDLRKGQSIVGHLLTEGHRVYLIDWGVPTRMDTQLDLGDYCLRMLKDAASTAARDSQAQKVHLFGYCLGGTFSLIFATQYARLVDSVIALTTPVDLKDPGAMGRLIDEKLIEFESLKGGLPIVPGELLWSAFQSLDPLGNLRKTRGFLERQKDQEFVARFKAQESWLADSVPMTARVMEDIVVKIYRNNGLVNETLHLKHKHIQFSKCQVPVVNLVAERDTIVPPAASLALEEIWGGRVENHVFKGGHLGVAVGSKAPQNMWSVVSRWLHKPVGFIRKKK